MSRQPRKHEITKRTHYLLRVFVSSCLIPALVLMYSTPASAYLIFSITINDRPVPLKWARTPVRYFVTDRGVPGVSSLELQAAVGRAFNTWQAVPTASITYQSVGFTSALPFQEDGQNTVGFLSQPEFNRVLASTNILFDNTTGEIIETDIFFNSTFQWSVAPSGETDKFDLESVALHEIGHMSGLGHSALGETELRAEGNRRVIAAEAVMFPIAYPAGNILDRSLRADDIAAISDLYPDNGFQDTTGSVSGSVTKSGRGLMGAHVTAFNPATGSLVAGFALNDQGRFTIAGLSPGPHVIRVEPLDDGDTDSFFTARTPFDLDFRVAFYNRLVIVPRGGDSGSIDIAVVPK